MPRGRMSSNLSMCTYEVAELKAMNRKSSVFGSELNNASAWRLYSPNVHITESAQFRKLPAELQLNSAQLDNKSKQFTILHYDILGKFAYANTVNTTKFN